MKFLTRGRIYFPHLKQRKMKQIKLTIVMLLLIGCLDTMDIEDCGCVETYSYSSIITVNGLPRTSYYQSEPKAVPCQDEREWKEKSSNNSIIGGYIDYKIKCN